MKKWILVLFFVGTSSLSFSQGCNDAGLCTTGSLSSFFENEDNDIAEQKEKNNNLILSQQFGLGEQNTLVFTTQIDANLNIRNGLYAQIKLPFHTIFGDLKNVSGLGDITLSLSYKITSEDKKSLSLLGGIKIPTNSSQLALMDRSLPMVYQTSLGTYDLLIGLVRKYNNWRFTAAYQHVLKQSNHDFNAELWPSTSKAYDYYNSNGLKRGNDIMLRAEYTLKSNKSVYVFGVLPLYRIGGDKVLELGEYHAPEGSEGITINVNASWIKPVSQHSLFRIMLAAPTITRSYRADGLTRSAVISFAFLQNF